MKAQLKNIAASKPRYTPYSNASSSTSRSSSSATSSTNGSSMGATLCSSSSASSSSTLDLEPLTDSDSSSTRSRALAFVDSMTDERLEMLLKSWANRTTEAGKAPKAGKALKAGKAPRPPNAFILFRYVFKTMNVSFVNAAKFSAAVWNATSNYDKKQYNKLAVRAKAIHAKMYPGYKYRPNPRKTSQRKRPKAVEPTKKEPEWDRLADLYLDGMPLAEIPRIMESENDQADILRKEQETLAKLLPADAFTTVFDSKATLPSAPEQPAFQIPLLPPGPLSTVAEPAVESTSAPSSLECNTSPIKLPELCLDMSKLQGGRDLSEDAVYVSSHSPSQVMAPVMGAIDLPEIDVHAAEPNYSVSGPEQFQHPPSLAVESSSHSADPLNTLLPELPDFSTYGHALTFFTGANAPAFEHSYPDNLYSSYVPTRTESLPLAGLNDFAAGMDTTQNIIGFQNALGLQPNYNGYTAWWAAQSYNETAPSAQVATAAWVSSMMPESFGGMSEPMMPQGAQDWVLPTDPESSSLFGAFGDVAL